jgi:YD repeat-containing protein
VARRGLAGAVLGGLILATVILAPRPARAAGGDYWVVGGDQATNQLIAFDRAVTDWDSAAAVKWTWKATSTRGFSSTEVGAAGNVSDVKLRDTAGGGQRFVTTAYTNTTDCPKPADTQGPNPYDLTYKYDGTGNITQSTSNGTTTTYTYPTQGANSVRPHAVSTVGANSYGYDNDGNLNSRTVNGVASTLTWDPKTIWPA